MSIYLKFFMNHAVNIRPIFGQKLHRWGKYSSFYSTLFFSKFIFEKSRVNKIYNCKMYINIVSTIAINDDISKEKMSRSNLIKTFAKKNR